MRAWLVAASLTAGVVLGCDPDDHIAEEREELMRTQREAIRAVGIARDRAAHRVAEVRRQAGEDVAEVEREAQDDIDEAAADYESARASRAARDSLTGPPADDEPASEPVPPPAGAL